MQRFVAFLSLTCITTQFSCSEAKTQFASAALVRATEQDELSASDPTRANASQPSPDAVQSKDYSAADPLANAAERKLEVRLSAPIIRTGNQTLQATALLNGVSQSAVLWSLTDDGVHDGGAISSSGVYTSPDASAPGQSLKIEATLVDDESVQGQAALNLIPTDQVFVTCQQSSSQFPIIAEVFRLPVNTAKLPNFDSIASSKAATVCMEQYSVATRSWTAGFPGVVDLFEWFGLRTKTKLQASAAGLYQFRLNSDDGAKLFIDGHLVINNDGLHQPKAVDGSLQLSAGSHDVVLEYYQGPRTQIALELFWIPAGSPAGTAFVYVPKASFR